MPLALALGVLVGCSQPAGPDPAPHPDVTASDAAVRLVADAEANLTLFASNQSFDDGKVRMTIAVDGLTVVDDDFYVADQHNWTSFPLLVSPGTHEITATTDSGASLRRSFRVPDGKTRYADIDYWGDDESAELSWLFQREPMAFG